MSKSLNFLNSNSEASNPVTTKQLSLESKKIAALPHVTEEFLTAPEGFASND